MKPQLDSHLTLFRLSAIIQPESCFQVNSACFLSPIISSFLIKPQFSCFRWHWPIFSVLEMCIFLLIFPQLSSKFSTANNAVSHFRLILFPSLCLIQLPEIQSLHMKFLCRLFNTDSISLTFATITQPLVLQSAPLKDGTSSIIERHLLSINMWSVWLWVLL